MGPVSTMTAGRIREHRVPKQFLVGRQVLATASERPDEVAGKLGATGQLSIRIPSQSLGEDVPHRRLSFFRLRRAVRDHLLEDLVEARQAGFFVAHLQEILSPLGIQLHERGQTKRHLVVRIEIGRCGG